VTAWLTPSGHQIACREKLRVLDDNLAEARQVLQDAYEDAVLMGVDPARIRQIFAELAAQLDTPHR